MMDGEGKKHPMTQKDKARIMSTQAKQHGGKTEKESFPARAQSAADKNEPQQKWLGLLMPIQLTEGLKLV